MIRLQLFSANYAAGASDQMWLECLLNLILLKSFFLFLVLKDTANAKYFKMIVSYLLPKGEFPNANLQPWFAIPAFILASSFFTVGKYAYKLLRHGALNVPNQIGDDESQDPLGFKSIVPYKGLPLKDIPEWPRYWKPGKFQMTMALRKLDINNWFKYDELFDSEHAAKLKMVNDPDSENYVDYLDGIDETILELLETVVTYLVKRFPDMFQADDEFVYINHLQEKYRMKEPFDFNPLAVIGLLVMDDVYVLKLGPKDRYTL